MKKTKTWVLALFVAACIAQAAVPLALVLREERTLAGGDVFRFRCAPVDPYDPFRGRYVALSFAVEAERIAVEEPFAPGDRAFATLEVDDDGFAHVGRVTRTHPDGVPAFHVRVRTVQDAGVSIDLPFDRYFIDETVAPEVEGAWRDAVRDRDVTTWAEVRVRAGDVALTGLYVDDVRIEDYVRARTPQ